MRRMDDSPDVRAPRHSRSTLIGGLGLACGLVALGVSLLPSWTAPLYEQPAKPLPTRASEWIGQLRDYATGTTQPEGAAQQADAAPNPWRSPRLAVTSRLLAFAALACAAIAFVRREDARMVACTVALGAGGIAAYSLVTAVVVLLVALTAVALAVVARRA